MATPSSPALSSPPSSQSPGDLVRREILTPLKLSIAQAAHLLQTDRARLWRMVREKQPFSPAIAARIEVVFGLPMERLIAGRKPQLLVAWRSRVAAMKLRRYRPAPVRHKGERRRFEVAGAEADAFGLLLWKAIGVGRGGFREAAHKLGLDPSELSGILHGRRRPTQDMLRRRGLFARLQAAFPAGWREHGLALQHAATQLPARRHRVRRLQPIPS